MRGTAVIVGAGASGRGHVGQLVAESGYRLAFLERDEALCALLRRSGAYRVRLVSATPHVVEVRGYQIFHLGQREEFERVFRSAPLVFTTVGPENVPDVADYLRPLVMRWLQETDAASEGGVKNVLCCENMARGSSVLAEHLRRGFRPELLDALDARMGFPDCMIARVVTRPEDPLELLGEEYSEWTADRAAFRGSVLPDMRTLQLVQGQSRYLERKLFIHNTGHAMFGYLGHLRGYRFVHEAAGDPQIMDATSRAIEESGWAIAREHSFRDEVIRSYREALTGKCVLPQLPDALGRVIRDPLRKLGPEERFFGPVRLVLRHGRTPEYLLWGAAAAMACQLPEDAQAQEIERALAQGGVRAVLERAGVSVPPSIVTRLEELVSLVRERFARAG